jgi:hypothetical protein
MMYGIGLLPIFLGCYALVRDRKKRRRTGPATSSPAPTA